MNESIWCDTGKIKNYTKLEKNIESDITIIGGGLTGLTTAYYLTKENKNVVIVDKGKICKKTSGYTTGKITSQHGLFYDYLLNSIGEEKTKEYLYANENAIENIYNIVKDEKIDCDFEWQNAYMFAQKQDDISKIEKEIEALNKIGFEAKFEEKINLPIENFGAICFEHQAQFNPYLYAKGLLEIIEKRGGNIFENSKVIDIEKTGNGYNICTENGNIKSNIVVIATHYPIIDIPGFYFMKMYQETSYLIAIDTGKKEFDGMYISCSKPNISFRTANYKGKKVVLIGGMEHKTGAKINLQNSYNELEKIGKKLFPDCKVLFRWNTEDCISLDKIPYIGEFSTLWKNVYIGTGYKKWGMTSSNVAGKIISNKILGIKNEYEDVFKSTRFNIVKNYKEVGNMLKEISYSDIFNKLKNTNERINDVKNEEGKIVEINGKKVGIYKDKNGKIYAVKPYCTHLGCELFWNDLDKSWDCPCHGSRFTYDGNIIYEPTKKNLEKIIIKEKDEFLTKYIN